MYENEVLTEWCRGSNVSGKKEWNGKSVIWWEQRLISEKMVEKNSEKKMKLDVDGIREIIIFFQTY